MTTSMYINAFEELDSNNIHTARFNKIRLFLILWSDLGLLWPKKKTLKIHARPLVFLLRMDIE